MRVKQQTQQQQIFYIQVSALKKVTFFFEIVL